MPRQQLNTVSDGVKPAARTPEEIVQILDLHERWSRKQSGGVCADLTFQVLSGANLSRINLRGAKLAGCDLSHSRLAAADLRDRKSVV